MYTGPILPPAATLVPGTYPAETSLYSCSAPVQRECPCIAGAPLYSRSVPVQLERLCVQGTAMPREKAALSPPWGTPRAVFGFPDNHP